ncbi:Hypothetical protein NTJ_14774 [Nesidiocoris tenuis]|nr:Hypothetical protein NTJ_14774 [Nesidiocoris tenuis]
MSSAKPAGDKAPCVGCPVQQDANDPAILKKLHSALATVNTPEQVDQITSVQTQVVAGTKYIVQFKTKQGKQCEASWVEQPWISEAPQYVNFKCE